MKYLVLNIGQFGLAGDEELGISASEPLWSRILSSDLYWELSEPSGETKEAYDNLLRFCVKKD